MVVSNQPRGKRVSNAQMNTAHPASAMVAEISVMKPAFLPLLRMNMLIDRNRKVVSVNPNWSIRMQPFGPDGEACGPAREARTAQQGVMT